MSVNRSAGALMLLLVLALGPEAIAQARGGSAPSAASLDARLRAVEARLDHLEPAAPSRPPSPSPSASGRRVTFSTGSSFAIYPRGCAHHVRDVVCEFRVERLPGGQDKTFRIIANILAGITSIIGPDGNQFPANYVHVAHENDFQGGGSREVALEVGEQASFEMMFLNAAVQTGSARVILKVAGQLDAQHRVVVTVPMDVAVAS